MVEPVILQVAPNFSSQVRDPVAPVGEESAADFMETLLFVQMASPDEDPQADLEAEAAPDPGVAPKEAALEEGESGIQGEPPRAEEETVKGEDSDVTETPPLLVAYAGFPVSVESVEPEESGPAPGVEGLGRRAVRVPAAPASVPLEREGAREGAPGGELGAKASFTAQPEAAPGVRPEAVEVPVLERPEGEAFASAGLPPKAVRTPVSGTVEEAGEGAVKAPGAAEASQKGSGIFQPEREPADSPDVEPSAALKGAAVEADRRGPAEPAKEGPAAASALRGEGVFERKDAQAPPAREDAPAPGAKAAQGLPPEPVKEDPAVPEAAQGSRNPARRDGQGAVADGAVKRDPRDFSPGLRAAQERPVSQFTPMRSGPEGARDKEGLEEGRVRSLEGVSPEKSAPGAGRQAEGPPTAQGSGVAPPAESALSGRAQAALSAREPRMSAILSQVVENAKVDWKENGGEIRMNLHPPHLGGLRIQLKVEGDRVHAHIVAQSPQVREILSSQVHDLRQSFLQHGLRLDDLSVAVGGQQMDWGGGWEQAGARQGGGQGGLGAPLDGWMPDSEPGSLAVSAPARLPEPSGRVNLFA